MKKINLLPVSLFLLLLLISGQTMRINEFYTPPPAAANCPTWVRPSDWPAVLPVLNNKINILVGDFGSGVAFTATTASAVTYHVVWGDGATSDIASGASAQHQYTRGVGTSSSLGYTTFVINISSVNNILTWNASPATSYTSNPTYEPFLDVAFGTVSLTNLTNQFSDASGAAVYSRNLQNVTYPATMNSVVDASSTFSNCSGLVNVTMPTNMTSVTSMIAMCQAASALTYFNFPSNCNPTSLINTFFNCYSLKAIAFPSTMNSVTTMAGAFSGCYSLTSLILPTSMSALTGGGLNSSFQNCYSLVSLALPTTIGAVTDMSSMCQGASLLQKITFPSTMNSVTTMAGAFNGCYSLTYITLPTSMSACTNTSQLFMSAFSLTSVVLPTTMRAVVTATSMFNSCYNLVLITNISGFGSTTLAVDGTTMFYRVEQLTSLTTSAHYSAFNITGLASKLSKITSLTLSDATAPYAGNPAIDISYTSLIASAINSVFTGLPTVVNGSHIKITGALGAAGCNQLIATGKGWIVDN